MGDAAPAQAAVPGVETGDPHRDGAAFRRCLGQFATGITVITAKVGDALVGMTANSFTSVSLDPPLVLWSAKRTSASFPKFEAAAHFAINILSEDQIALSKHFGKPGDDKFRDIGWAPGIGGAPVLDGCLATFECRLHAQHPGGDHLIILGEVERFRRQDRAPLLFVQGRYTLAEQDPNLQLPGTGPGTMQARGPMDEFMTALLYRAHGALSGALEAGRRAEGLTLLQSRLMAAVETLPGRTVDELLPELFLGRNAAEATLDSLIAERIVTRDPNGRFSMTAEGRERNRRLLERAREIEAEKLSGLSKSDVAACRRVLDALVARSEPPAG